MTESELSEHLDPAKVLPAYKLNSGSNESSDMGSKRAGCANS